MSDSGRPRKGWYGDDGVENSWKELAESLDKLCACYRMQRRPPEALLDRITILRERVNREGEGRG